MYVQIKQYVQTRAICAVICGIIINVIERVGTISATVRVVCGVYTVLYGVA